VHQVLFTILVSQNYLTFSFHDEKETVWLITLGNNLIFWTVTFILYALDYEFNGVVTYLLKSPVLVNYALENALVNFVV